MRYFPVLIGILGVSQLIAGPLYYVSSYSALGGCVANSTCYGDIAAVDTGQLAQTSYTRSVSGSVSSNGASSSLSHFGTVTIPGGRDFVSDLIAEFQWQGTESASSPFTQANARIYNDLGFLDTFTFSGPGPTVTARLNVTFSYTLGNTCQNAACVAVGFLYSNFDNAGLGLYLQYVADGAPHNGSIASNLVFATGTPHTISFLSQVRNYFDMQFQTASASGTAIGDIKFDLTVLTAGGSYTSAGGLAADAVPEPSTSLLLLGGMAALTWLRRRGRIRG